MFGTPLSTFDTAGSGRETWATSRSVFKTLFENNLTDVADRDQQ
jgi:hypothetical protein